MAFPAAKTTFVDPAGTNFVAGTPVGATAVDHAAQHTAHNNLLEEIEDNLGTNSGTSVLQHFTVGQFPVRVTGIAAVGTLQQTVVGGTFNNNTIGTPTVTGGTVSGALIGGTPNLSTGSVNNTSLGTPTLTLGGDSTGDIFYRSAGGTATRLAIGTNTQILTTNGTTPSWGTVGLFSKVISATRDLAAASGTVAYTGVGFIPTSLIVFGGINGTTFPAVWGMADSSRAGLNMNYVETPAYSDLGSTTFIYLHNAGGAFQSGTVVSYDTDGFSLGWTKTGSPTGTAFLYFLCFK